MHPLDRQLLGFILAETRRVEGLSRIRALTDDPTEWKYRMRAIRELPLCGVQIDGKWLGTTGAQIKAQQRSLRRLEEAGLVELFAVTTSRVSHVLLTLEGRAAAEGFANE